MTDTPVLSVRLDLSNGTRFGPGKAALLGAIDRTGSIRGAAEALSMSYPRALKLIDQMNRAFSEPLILTQHGGAEGGGASLSQTGQTVLTLYQQICDTSMAASMPLLQDLQALQSDL